MKRTLTILTILLPLLAGRAALAGGWQYQAQTYPPGTVLDGLYWPNGVTKYVPVWVPDSPAGGMVPGGGSSEPGIRRLPRYKTFPGGVRGELVEEEGEEEKVRRHRGTNRGRYRLYKYVPAHRDPDTKEWIPGHREELGEEEVGDDLDKEDGQRRSWSWRKKGY